MTQKDIMLQHKGDIGKMMNPGSEKHQSMRGFDEDYVDIVDYIIRCTHKIWEEKGVGLIYTHYLHNCVVHTSSGQIYGRDEVVAGTIQAIAAFPDRRLYGDEVIWTGDDEVGYYSSHRLTHVGHNTGYSAYGPPTGRRVAYNAIANCLVKENRIVEEWLIRDELSLVRQLGFNVPAMVKQMVKLDQERGIQTYVPGEVERLQGQLPPMIMPAQTTEGFDIDYFIRRAFHEVWNWRLLNKIDEYYAVNYQAYMASDRHLYGLGDLKAFILSIMSPFPDIALTVDHVCWTGNAEEGYRVATRWTMMGTHSGPGIYGKPTGKRIRIMGTSHQLLKQEKIVQEWTLFDEFALLKQIYVAEG